jgi:hypothetical protein
LLLEQLEPRLLLDAAGPRILSYTPHEVRNDVFDHIELTFDQAIDPATFTLDDVSIDGPSGAVPVSYTVRPKAGVPSGTEIHNRASIVFDYNDSIDTPLVLNTLDVGTPRSSVDVLPATTASLAFDVWWSGVDEPGGSGIAGYDVYVSDNRHG